MKNLHCSPHGNRMHGNKFRATRNGLFHLLGRWRLGDHAANSVWSINWRGGGEKDDEHFRAVTCCGNRTFPTAENVTKDLMNKKWTEQFCHEPGVIANKIFVQAIRRYRRAVHERKNWTIVQISDRGGGYSRTFRLWYTFGGHCNKSDEN